MAGDTTEKPGAIYSAISNAMAKIEAIAKDKKNTQQGYKFRGIDDVYNRLHPILAEHHIFTTPEVLEDRHEERITKSGGALLYRILKIRYTFWTDDGSSVCATVIGEGMDSGDKASNKAMAVAHKYALFQVFCIPTEDMQDPDAETPPESLPAPKPSEDVVLLKTASNRFKAALEDLDHVAPSEAVEDWRARGKEVYKKHDHKRLLEMAVEIERGLYAESSEKEVKEEELF